MPETSSRSRSTRAHILDNLKRGGPNAASTLAAELNLTAMAVRQHLYVLQDEKLVIATNQAIGRGRPTKIWALTKATEQIFPDAHQDLAVDLLTHIRSQFGENGLHQIIDRHSQQQIQTYTKALAGTTILHQRLLRLAEIRSGEGYMAEVQADGDHFLFIENHCPVCAAASICTRLCSNELRVFQTVLGPNISIIRREHILDGKRRCLYEVRDQGD